MENSALNITADFIYVIAILFLAWMFMSIIIRIFYVIHNFTEYDVQMEF